MTISAIYTPAYFTGNGTSTVFPFAFKVFSSADLQVILTTGGLAETLTITTDYTVSLNADQNNNPGGSVTMLSAPVVGETLAIARVLEELQETDITNGGGFYPQVIEDALDRLTMLAQQNADSVARAFRLPVNIDTTNVSTELPEPEAGKIVAWNGTALALENIDPSSLATIAAYGTTTTDLFDGNGVTTDFSLSSNPGSINNLLVAVGGVVQSPVTDYTWSSGTTITFTTAPPSGTDNVYVRYAEAIPQGSSSSDLVSFTPELAGAVDTSVEAKLREIVSVKDFGAVGDGTTDDTTAIQTAINAALGTSGGALFFPKGTYKLTAALTIPQVVGVRIFGESIYGTKLTQYTANTPIFLFDTCTSHQFELDHFTLTYNSAQANTQTSAIPIYFKGTNGSSAEGFYNFSLHHLWITNAFRAIGAKQAGGDAGGLAVWGFHIDRLVTSVCSGASIYVNPSPSIGIPQGSITNILINVAATAEQVIILGSIQELHGQNWSISGGSLTDTNQALAYFETCTSFDISGVHLEDTNVTATDLTRAFFIFANCSGILRGVVGSFTMANAAQCSVVNANSGGVVNVETVRVGCTTTGAGQVIAIFVGAFGRLFDYAWTTTGSASASTVYATTTAVDAWDATNAFQTTGTATLGIAFGGGTTGITYGARQCRWTRIGNLIFLRFRILLSSKGSSTGAVSITGLPFTVNASADSTLTPINVSNASVVDNIGFFPNASLKTAALYYGQVGGSYTNLTDANFTNTTDISGHLFYEADWT